MENNLSVFIKRLKKIGIETTYLSNYPWVYLDTICGKKVKEKFCANHGFTVGWYRENGVEFTDLKEIFNLIRKYK